MCSVIHFHRPAARFPSRHFRLKKHWAAARETGVHSTRSDAFSPQTLRIGDFCLRWFGESAPIQGVGHAAPFSIHPDTARSFAVNDTRQPFFVCLPAGPAASCLTTIRYQIELW